MEFFLGAFESEWEQRRAALLHELSLGSSVATSAEEETRRRLRELQIAGGAAAASGGSVPKMRRPSSRALTSAGRRHDTKVVDLSDI